jgi:hypothetical protein
MSPVEDLPARYHDYLERFAREVGDFQVGTFAKHAGRLIKKLSFEEFTPAFIEYTEIAEAYRAAVERGDTINDIVLKVLREQSAALVLPAPKV